MDWPSPLRNKGVFYVKREPKPLPEEAGDLLDHMTCGDIHPNSLGKKKILEQIFHSAIQIISVPWWRRLLCLFSRMSSTWPSSPSVSRMVIISLSTVPSKSALILF